MGVLSSFVLLAVGFTCLRVEGDQTPSLQWAMRRIPWALNSRLTNDILDRDATRAAITASFAHWEAVGCSDAEFEFLGEGPSFVPQFREQGPNTNVVAFLSDWTEDESTVALTVTKADSTNGTIYDSDIILNDEHYTFVIADVACDRADRKMMDLENTVTHEVGHLLGLDHPPKTDEFKAVTMFADAPACQISKRTLEQDNIDGACFLYPAAADTGSCPIEQVMPQEGCGCRATPPRGPAGPLLFMIIACGGWAVRARRRSLRSCSR